MRGLAIFRGGPLDEEQRELHDLIPEYRVAWRDHTGPKAHARLAATWQVDDPQVLGYTELRYRRGPIRRGLNGERFAIYEFIL